MDISQLLGREGKSVVFTTLMARSGFNPHPGYVAASLEKAIYNVIFAWWLRISSKLNQRKFLIGYGFVLALFTYRYESARIDAVQRQENKYTTFLVEYCLLGEIAKPRA